MVDVWESYRSEPALCLVKNCGKLARVKNLCQLHYARWSRRFKDQPIESVLDELNKDGPKRIAIGTRKKDSNGYISIKLSEDDPMFIMANSHWVFEHRLLMARYLGRPLIKGENVHHKNGKRDDNRLDNLELWKVFQPRGQRINEQAHCETCTCN